MPIAEDLFAKIDALLHLRKTIHNEIITQMKNKTANATRIEALINKNIEQLSLKLAKFSNIFTEFQSNFMRS